MSIKSTLKTLLLLLSIILVGCSADQSIADINEELDSTALTSSSLSNFYFGNLEIEESWNAAVNSNGTYSTTSHTIDLSNTVDEAYFYENSDGDQLNLKCKAEDGRRAEFKEPSGEEGPLTQYRKIDFTAVYFSIPENGVTIAQVHNRGDGGGKPLFRLELEADGTLKTVLRDLPNGTSTTDTNSIPDFIYDEGDSIRIILKKDNGLVYLKIRQNSEWVINTTFEAPEAWNVSNVKDFYYLKAGVYTEGNDEEARVKYKKFKISY
ncbi:polysaccharide lyase family 7 protein [Cellulophaga baltica]|uniref:polysaccharide lyase family 7 protein n=1 Tax=Cellulophaga TaxID=104264 RepID=UPI001C067E7D|nr:MULTISPECIES: polysaccharide lyase family 7 protein [Cellulophaga]MBU2996299.1 polysaccharide lyase family 7 protein [Cellulophaga baltica]MDO6767694.1 polysaccharide lyase family 7 protein [Cellulophaga sp. 1_MG-2023]